jgi:serine/threonine protein kinase
MEKIIDGRYKIRSLIGEGNFGKVFSAKDMQNKNYVAVKLEQNCKNNSQLANEIETLKVIQGARGIPKLIGSGEWNEHKYMVTELLGSSLHTLFLQYKKKFSLNTVVAIAEQSLARLETLHKKHYLHRDIKPRQFVIGRKTDAETVYMLDFGLSKKYQTGDLGLHIPYLENRPFVGTIYYASINVHLGIQQCRRDDLESYLYMLSYLIKGQLPWMSLPRIEQSEIKVRILKSTTSAMELFDGAPGEFLHLFQYVRSLQFESRPDYDYMRELLKSIRIREKILLNDLEWCLQKKESPVKEIVGLAGRERARKKSAGGAVLAKKVKKRNKSLQSVKRESEIRKKSSSFITAKTMQAKMDHECSLADSKEESPARPSHLRLKRTISRVSIKDLSETIINRRYPEIKNRDILAKALRKRSKTINLIRRKDTDISEFKSEASRANSEKRCLFSSSNSINS